jgi:hypothetical protein
VLVKGSRVVDAAARAVKREPVPRPPSAVPSDSFNLRQRRLVWTAKEKNAPNQ